MSDPATRSDREHHLEGPYIMLRWKEMRKWYKFPVGPALVRLKLSFLVPAWFMARDGAHKDEACVTAHLVQECW